MPAVVETEALTKRFGDLTAVDSLDLEVHDGEVFGFLGPNGAGKSTTVRMLTTLMRITSGTAEVAGVDVARDPDAARHKIGVALQEAELDYLTHSAAAAASFAENYVGLPYELLSSPSPSSEGEVVPTVTLARPSPPAAHRSPGSSSP